MTELKVEYVEVKKLETAWYNPRRFDSVEFKRIVESIKEFGLTVPILVNDRNNVIVSGNQRFKAAIQLGFKEVPVVYTTLTDEREKALNIIMNELGMEFDEEKLENLLKEIEDMSIVDKTLSHLLQQDADKENRDRYGNPEMEFVTEINERYNYMVVIFDNDIDYLNAQTKFGMENVIDPMSSKKLGSGRVVKWKQILEMING